MSKPKPAKNILFDPAGLKSSSLFAKLAKNNPQEEKKEEEEEDETPSKSEDKPKLEEKSTREVDTTVKKPFTFTPPLGDFTPKKELPKTTTQTSSAASDLSLFDENNKSLSTISPQSSEMLNAQKVEISFF